MSPGGDYLEGEEELVREDIGESMTGDCGSIVEGFTIK